MPSRKLPETRRWMRSGVINMEICLDMSFIWPPFKYILTRDWFIPLTVVIGAAWSVIVLLLNSKNVKRNNELLNQPKFEFYDSMNCHTMIRRSCDDKYDECEPTPSFCGNQHQCNDLHWFDIKNCGGFPAENISITLLLINEWKDRKQLITNRTVKCDYLQAGESFQVKLPKDCISFNNHFFNEDEHHYEFVVLVKYKSSYSGYKYRRIYIIDAENSDDFSNRTNWDGAICFYQIAEMNAKCSKDVSICKKVFARLFNNNALDKWVYNFLG